MRLLIGDWHCDDRRKSHPGLSCALLFMASKQAHGHRRFHSGGIDPLHCIGCGQPKTHEASFCVRNCLPVNRVLLG